MPKTFWQTSPNSILKDFFYIWLSKFYAIFTTPNQFLPDWGIGLVVFGADGNLEDISIIKCIEVLFPLGILHWSIDTTYKLLLYRLLIWLTFPDLRTLLQLSKQCSQQPCNIYSYPPLGHLGQYQRCIVLEMWVSGSSKWFTLEMVPFRGQQEKFFMYCLKNTEGTFVVVWQSSR